MLAEHKLKTLQGFLGTLTREELLWANGYLNGIVTGQGGKDAAVIEPSNALVSSVQKITIAYGTETGNSKKIATELATKAKKHGIGVKLVSLDQYRLPDLAKEEYFFTVLSTHGEGEPPAAAKKFYDHIHNNGFKLDKLKYSVLALGDTSYPLFCKTGEDVDAQLNNLGGIRIAPLQKCDLEFDAVANEWCESILQSLTENEPTAAASQPAVNTVVAPAKKAAGKKIYAATVLNNINLNDRDSNKETYHIELGVDETVDYEPGDSVGIVPENPAAVVETILLKAGIDVHKEIEFREEWFTAFDLLKKKLSIFFLTATVVKKYAAITAHNIPDIKIDLLDLLQIYPVKDAAQFEEVLNILNPLAPRLYTVASSPLAHSGEVHFTVLKDKFLVNDAPRFGLCSTYLGETLPENELKFFVQKNKRFRLPADDKNIIMIGPGTGIAAFRSFIAERDARGATGKNWLFFADEKFASDFLYQTEIQNWLDIGVLTKVNAAFSFDYPAAGHIEDKLLKNGPELYAWLQQGAYIYICGEKHHCHPAEVALLQIVVTVAHTTTAQAQQFIDHLKDQGRYAKDLY